MPEPDLLPPLPQREWALQAMAKLVEVTGFSQLVVFPLIEPTEAFFPERWGGGERSVARLARRLLHYAGIDDRAVAVEIVDDPPPLANRAHAGVWFAASEPGMCRFGVASEALRDPKDLVAALARAVTEAFRDTHRLVHTDPEIEARLVDLTAVYLGFGVLTADAALRHQGRGAGGMQTQRRVIRLGAIGPQLTCFVLAIALQARGRNGELARANKWLRANERAFLKAALVWLERRDVPLRRQLDVPEPETWAPSPSLEDFVGPNQDDEDDADDEPEERRDVDRGIVGKNAGQPVFRVERSMARRLGYVGMFGTMMLGGVALRSVQGIEIDMTMIGAVGLGLGGLGLLVGRLMKESRCSEPQCGAPLPADATTCPRCHGTIAGVIHNPKERLAAAERLRQPSADESTSAKPT